MGWNIQVPDAEYYDHTTSGEVIERLVREITAQKAVAIDSETDGLIRWKSLPYYWSLSWEDLGRERRVMMPASTLEWFTPLFKERERAWVFANAKFDVHMFANRGIDILGKLHDTAVMHALLYEEQPHDLKSMAKQVLGWRWTDFQDTFGSLRKGTCECGANVKSHKDEVGFCKKTGCLAFRQVTPLNLLERMAAADMHKLVDYASNDAYGTWKVYLELKKQLEAEPTWGLFVDEWPYIRTLADYFFNVEVPFTRALFTCERNGIKVDRQYLEELSPKLLGEIQELRTAIVQEAGYLINPGSDYDLREYFFEKLRLPVRRWTKGGKSGIKLPSVDAPFLESVRDDVKLADLVLQLKSLVKTHSTYVEEMPSRLDPQDRVHPALNQDVARTGRLSSSDPNCFSGDTEILTNRGWVRFDGLGDESVAQWENGHISFVVPTSYIKLESRELIRLYNQHIDLAVTPDHRCLLRNRKTGALKVFSARAYPEDWQQIGAGQYRSSQASNLTLEELQFLCAVQADGSWIRGRRTLDFSFKKVRKIKRFEAILKKLGANYRKAKNKDGKTRFYIPEGRYTELALEYLGWSKQFGPWLLNLPPQLLAAFCAEVNHWDGCFTRNNHYSSDDYRNADWVQIANVLTGNRANVRRYRKANGGYNYQVDSTAKDFSLTTNIEREALSTGATVYCVSVPSSYIVVRRNGKASVTGQCQNIPTGEKDKEGLRRTFIANKHTRLLVYDYDQLEMRLLAAASMDPGMCAGFHDPKYDIHADNVFLMFGTPYDDVVSAKKIDKQIKQGALNETALSSYLQECLTRRDRSKTLGFGLNYGMKEKALARRMGVPLAEAIDITNRYMDARPAVRKFFEEAITEAREAGTAYTVLGRRRRLPNIWSTNEMDRWQAERQATNLPIQGCLPAETRILTTNGYLPIGAAPETGVVWTGISWEPYTKLARGPWQLATLTLDNGQVLRCDTRHKILVLEDDYKFKEYAELVEGDLVCCSMAQPLEFGAMAPMSTPVDFYWMGYSIGNGHTSDSGAHRNALTLTFGDRKGRYERGSKASEFCAYIEGKFGVRTQKSQVDSDNKKRIVVTVENKLVRQMLQTWGYPWGKTAEAKTTPAAVWTAPLAARIQYLTGLLDADGTIGGSESNPNIHLCQQKLLAETQMLLRTVGVESKIRGPYRQGKSISWRLDLIGGQAFRHLNYGTAAKIVRVPFMQTPKLARSGIKATELASDSHKTIFYKAGKTGELSPYTLREMYEAAGKKAPELYATRRLVRKESLPEVKKTYTLSVDHASHRFDSEGVISKNTAADVCKVAMVLINEERLDLKYDCRMLLQVHDELIFELPEEAIPVVQPIIKEWMEHPFTRDLACPLTVASGAGVSWGTAK